ncbi:UNVERIFIED_CONTAM: External alternative NAD(P)H-ubiquinone oxidoreductase B2, mitochondrial [Sesamum angustifolium]|uniref:NADH:ubiquinone reductase (non-electrogenic) n=1 Tax=Sesamum angustifolium TaxID=2727405 RepID=A0AAW2PDW0_9LAMI
MGARPNTFNIPGVAENCHFLKEIEDAQKIRRTIIDCFERASLPNLSEEEREKILHFVVVGGGPTGLTRITAFAEEKFQRDGIDVKTGAMVVKVSDKEISTKELKNGGSVSTMPYGMVVWSTGIGTRPVIMDFMKQIGQANRRVLATDEWLRVEGCDSIYALGDCATINQRKVMMHTLADLLKASKGDAVKESVEVNLEEFKSALSQVDSQMKNLPATAQVAAQQGSYLADCFNRMEECEMNPEGPLRFRGEGRHRFRPFRYKHFGQFAPLGGEQTAAQLPGDWVSIGHSTQWLWYSVYASKLVSWRTRALGITQYVLFSSHAFHVDGFQNIYTFPKRTVGPLPTLVIDVPNHGSRRGGTWGGQQRWQAQDPDKAATEIVVLDSDASEIDIIDGAESGSASASASAGRSSCVSRAVPPFLLKIYDMLGNDETNSLISWSSTGTSFVVMDPQLFAVNVLPIYFKHRNFQSFITQLNSYGFKKISWEKWEYKNEYFRKGEKHLLRNIKRIYQSNSHRTRSAAPGVDSSSCSRNIEEELELLKKENDILNSEIKKLKEKQEILEEKVASLTYQAVNNEVNKRRTKLFAAQTVPLNNQTDPNTTEKNLKGKRKLEEESAATDEYQMPTMCSGPGSCSATSMENILELISEHFIRQGKMVLDEGETGQHQPSAFISLVDLMGESSDWVEHIKEMQEKANHLKS